MAENKIGIEIAVSGDADVQFKKLTDSVVRFEAAGTKSLGSFTRAFEVMGGVLGADVVRGAFVSLQNVAMGLFDTFIVQGVHAANQQEDATNELAVAMGNAGQFTRAALDDMVAFAAGLQQTTRVSDETILSTAALIENLAQLDKDTLQRATRATLDMAAALRKDLNSAAMLVGKAAQGNVESFHKWGIEIQKGATDAQTFANALTTLEARFGGSAAAQVRTFSGATEQLRNNFNEIQEATSGAITNNQAYINTVNELSRISVDLSTALAANSKEMKEGLAAGLILAIDLTAGLVVGMDALGRAISTTWNGLVIVVATAGEAIARVLGVVSESQRAVAEQFSNMAVSAAEAIESNLTGGDTGLSKVVALLARMRGAAQTGFDAIQAGADRGIEAANRQADALAKATDEQKKLAEEGKKLADAAGVSSPQEKYAHEVEALKAARAEDLITEAAHQEALAEAKKKRDDATSQEREKEINDLLTKNEAMKTIDADANAAAITGNKAKVDAIVAKENEGSTLSLKVKAKLAAEEKKISEEKVSAARDSFGNIATAARLFGKETFGIFKAAATAQAIIAGYEGVAKAIAKVELFPFNFVLAGTIGLMTAAQVKNIQSTNLATGIDSVPGIGTADNFPAMLSPGERVVPSETNRDLRAFLAESVGMREILASIDAKLNRPIQVIVQIGGRTIFDEIRSGLEEGRTFAVS